MRRGIAAVSGSRILGAERERCRRRPILVQPAGSALGRRVAGRRIEEVARLGKRVVLKLDSGDRLIFEPRMTGLVLVADPPTVEHLRFRLDLADGPIPHVWYWDRRGLGSVRLLTDQQFADQLGNGKLGPDALALSPNELRDRLAHSRRPIKVALVDQRSIAGIGNLYASEILHLARIHPAKRCDLLAREQWSAVHACLLEVLENAILHEGSTLSDGTYRNALNQSGGYQNHHRVYDRAGTPCMNCGSPIERIVQAQRSTFFCPKCQTKPRKQSRLRPQHSLVILVHSQLHKNRPQRNIGRGRLRFELPVARHLILPQHFGKQIRRQPLLPRLRRVIQPDQPDRLHAPIPSQRFDVPKNGRYDRLAAARQHQAESRPFMQRPHARIPPVVRQRVCSIGDLELPPHLHLLAIDRWSKPSQRPARQNALDLRLITALFEQVN